MNILAISINHRTAPVELREALHLNADEIKSLIHLAKEELFSEGLIISTCNRTELYGIPKDEKLDVLDIQIYHQVKESFQTAEEMQFAGVLMKRVFDAAIKAGKRAISETEISEGAVTVSYAAVQ